MYIFGNEISEPVYFRHHYLDMYILGNEKLLDVYFRDKPIYMYQYYKSIINCPISETKRNVN